MLNYIKFCHLSVHLFILSKSACKAMASESDLINLPIFVSSASLLISLLIPPSTSLVHIKNNNDPKTYSCGTLLITWIHSALQPFITTLCRLSLTTILSSLISRDRMIRRLSPITLVYLFHSCPGALHRQEQDISPISGIKPCRY